MNKQSVNMGEGRVLSVLFRLGGPAMLSLFFQNLYALADTVFVSRLGTSHLAALSLCLPLFYVSLALGRGLSVGTIALLSHARGAEDSIRAKAIVKSALPLVLLVLCPFCLLAFPVINQPLFRTFGIDGSVLAEVDRFVFWLAWMFPVLGFALLCEGILISHGDSKTPMKAMIAGNILNIVLDPFLIFTCELGVAGASLASLVGWSFSCLLMCVALKRRNMDRPQLNFSRADTGIWRQIVNQGLPVSLGLLVIPFSMIGLNYVLASFGAAYVAAWNVSSRLEMMLVLPLYGLASSLIPFTGFNLGKGSVDRIREAVRLCLRICYLIQIPVGIAVWLGAREIISLFETDADVLELSTFAFRAALAGYLFVPLELVMTNLAQGLKKPKYTFYVNVSRVLLLRLPLAVAFGLMWGGQGTYLSHPVSMTVTGLASAFLLRRLLRLADLALQPNMAEVETNAKIVDWG